MMQSGRFNTTCSTYPSQTILGPQMRTIAETLKALIKRGIITEVVPVFIFEYIS